VIGRRALRAAPDGARVEASGSRPDVRAHRLRTLGPPAQDERLVTVGDTHQTLVTGFSNGYIRRARTAGTLTIDP
jgi:hypothetical protein